MGRITERLKTPARTLLRVGFLLAAIRPTLDFYHGSWRLAARRIAGVFMREGFGGIVRRAYILLGRPMDYSDERFSPALVYGQLPPLAPDFVPRVSIIVPNYNHACYLRERLESIYQQTYQNVEVILLDDCSSDESTTILQEFAARYPEKTRCQFNTVNSGGVFNQWKKGLGLATGGLVWIAESDDYCSGNFLEELVRCFQNPGVMLAFARCEFVQGTPAETVWTTSDYLHDLGPDIWGKPFIRSAHAMITSGWAIKNLLPNVSSALFRHPGQLTLFDDPRWYGLRLCGDWIFYISVIRGGLVAYSPHATNYYRQHPKNTSVDAQKDDDYYAEHEIVAGYLVSLYHVERNVLDKQELYLYSHWCSRRGANRRRDFQQLYSLDRVWRLKSERLPNLVMAVYALTAGGGETFPIMLANLLKQKGYPVTLFNCHAQPTEPGVRDMLSPTIPVLELEQLEHAAAAFSDMGIELVHSHHAWVDVSLATLLLGYPGIRQVITMHGMYEMMTSEQLDTLTPVLQRRISRIVYTAEKNVKPFPYDFRRDKGFRRIDNALPAKQIFPISRDELMLSPNDFVFCCVARAIPDKGWEEAIEAVIWANAHSPRQIRLLLIGEGPEAVRLRSHYSNEFVRFLGFRSNIRDYFAMSDAGLLPSRFKGESAPLVLIDCLLSGKPALASNVGDIRSMLDTTSGLAGELFELTDWQIDIPALGEIMRRLANDDDAYNEILDRVPIAAAKFETSGMLQEYEAIYRDVLRISDNSISHNETAIVGEAL
ncbi:glycosyltransferase [Mesorhizobium sp. ESP6-5]|uniref:glycosyltransferase n=1 Tax=Mesorhizobium sp. ESP6-5 TaxID=2876623 RepID=UPI001CCBCB25|nr:glycosyltransferase [Mesorhizobium sp. ESP6-5]MBZ9755785.1 glycosyltransferase [Mesorhizobium sp. ESP6-5]